MTCELLNNRRENGEKSIKFQKTVDLQLNI